MSGQRGAPLPAGGMLGDALALRDRPPQDHTARVPNPLHCDSVSFCMADVNHILKTTSFCYYYSYLPTHWLKVPAEEIGSWFCLQPWPHDL